MPKSLPCAFFRAHDKDTSCRVPQRKHTAKRKYSANPTLSRVPSLDTRQTLRFAVCRLPDTGEGSAHDRHVLMPSGAITPRDGDPFLSCAYTWHTGKPSFRRVPRARHTAKSLHREACLMDVSVCRVPRKAHGEQLPLLCASPVAHGKKQPLLCASLQHTANLFKIF